MLAYVSVVADEAVGAAIARILQRAHRDEEDRGDLLWIGAQGSAGRDHAHERRHVYLAGASHRALETAQHVDARGVDSDFFLRLAQRRVEQGFIGRVDAAAGKCHLSAMALDMVGASDIDHMQVAVELKDRHQHRGSATRAGAMAREPIGWLEALAQPAEALVDLLPRTHVPVLLMYRS